MLTPLKTISSVSIPPHSIATIPAKGTGKYTANTPCIFEVEIDYIIGV